MLKNLKIGSKLSPSLSPSLYPWLRVNEAMRSRQDSGWEVNRDGEMGARAERVAVERC